MDSVQEPKQNLPPMVVPTTEEAVPPPPPTPASMAEPPKIPAPVPAGGGDNAQVVKPKKRWGTGALVGSFAALMVLMVGLGFGIWQVRQNQNVKRSLAAGPTITNICGVGTNINGITGGPVAACPGDCWSSDGHTGSCKDVAIAGNDTFIDVNACDNNNSGNWDRCEGGTDGGHGIANINNGSTISTSDYLGGYCKIQFDVWRDDGSGRQLIGFIVAYNSDNCVQATPTPTPTPTPVATATPTPTPTPTPGPTATPTPTPTPGPTATPTPTPTPGPTATPTPTPNPNSACQRIDVLRGGVVITKDQIQAGDQVVFRGFATANDTTVTAINFAISQNGTVTTHAGTNFQLVGSVWQADSPTITIAAANYSVTATPIYQ